MYRQQQGSGGKYNSAQQACPSKHGMGKYGFKEKTKELFAKFRKGKPKDAPSKKCNPVAPPASKPTGPPHLSPQTQQPQQQQQQQPQPMSQPMSQPMPQPPTSLPHSQDGEPSGPSDTRHIVPQGYVPPHPGTLVTYAENFAC
ncbi:hypothetical protein L211DRAFT_899893 [Terfezia boudieri ATCC MYA-4762]|uniref:Uncharacterized protein n=1 Tax=Terfezia boudieri ATCC MYA-4762 TaxID=1051890 RepID=A0A3N4LZF5_9PEZI|nr:hypothetical protein L211DRAFT_899893 [Terfezia boudieri ATCC MYA-4762]